MGYHLNRLDEPIFIAVSKPLLTEFEIHHILESCEQSSFPDRFTFQGFFLIFSFVKSVADKGG